MCPSRRRARIQGWVPSTDEPFYDVRPMPRETYGFGLARSLDFHTSVTCFTELCELLSEATGQVFYPHHALSYGELSAGLGRGDLGLAWAPPIPAIDLLERTQATLLVTPVRKGSTLYHSALVVRRGGPK